MAAISGYTPGTIPVQIPAVMPKAKKVKEPKKVLCASCGGEVVEHKRGRNRFYTDDENQCYDCGIFFGVKDGFLDRGCTNAAPEEATEKITAAKVAGWVMVLHAQTLGAPGDVAATLQLGDIVKVSRALPIPGAGVTSTARTRGMFMIDVTVGPLNLSLYPHEFSAVPFITIMDLKQRGEIEEQFVSPDDETGYFAPSPKMREEILAAFGNR